MAPYTRSVPKKRIARACTAESTAFPVHAVLGMEIFAFNLAAGGKPVRKSYKPLTVRSPETITWRPVFLARKTAFAKRLFVVMRRTSSESWSPSTAALRK
eukprot:3935443-Rhodomonas_salina.2